MTCFLYILSNKQNKSYIGITKLEPNLRLERHNRGDVKSTKIGKPWQLIHVEKFDSYLQARFREKQIKSWHGGNALHKLISKSAGSSNGRTTAFGAVYLGSNPSPAAILRQGYGIACQCTMFTYY